jgi:hypothetical protein
MSQLVHRSARAASSTVVRRAVSQPKPQRNWCRFLLALVQALAVPHC